MDFVTWWFDTHYIWSTILTPWLTFIWCIFKGSFWRGVVAFIFSRVSFSFTRNTVSRIISK